MKYMGRSWQRYDASLEDIKRCRKAILSQFSNATDIYFDEYLVDTHQNEYCNANKFYYGAILETKDGRFQAATSYGRIGDYNKAFGGIKAFDEGVFTNFDSAKRKLNEKLSKKKSGKRCSKCKTRQSYSPFAPKNAETTTFNATAYSMIEYQDDNCLEEIADSLRPKYGLEYNEGELFWDFDMQSGDVTLYIYDGDNKKLDEITYDREALAKALKEQGHKNPESWGADYTKGYTDTTQKIQYEDKYGQPKESIVQGLSGYAGNCPSCSKRINFPIDNSGLYCYDCQVYLRTAKGTGMDKTLQYDAETFEDFKRKMVGDRAVAGDVGYMESLEEFYEDYLKDFEQITDEFCPEPETFEEFQERVLKNEYETFDFEPFEAEGKKRSGLLSEPFEGTSLDSGEWKGILTGFGIGLLGLFGYSKLRK